MPKVRFFMGDDTEPFILKQPPEKSKKNIGQPEPPENHIDKIQAQPKKRVQYCNFLRWFFRWF